MCLDVARSNGGDVPAVEGCDLRDSESFGQSHDGRIRRAERHVLVPLGELGHPLIVGASELHEVEGAFGATTES